MFPSERGLLLVSGSRDNGDDLTRSVIYRELDAAEYRLKEKMPPSSRIHVMAGGARGTDLIAYEWAVLNQHVVLTMQAWWELYKKRTGRMIAGHIRNQEMVNFLCDSLYSGMYSCSEQLLFKRFGSRNRGTEDMEKRLTEAGFAPLEIMIKEKELKK